MRFYENPDWITHVAGVVRDPLDQTRRLVAADWLEEVYGDDPAALFRARLIRHQCGGYSPRLHAMRYGPHAGEMTAGELGDWNRAFGACGFDSGEKAQFYDPFPEPWLEPAWDFWSVGGFPEIVRFAPWRFCRDNVAPVFLNAPVRTCSLSHVHPRFNYHRPSGHRQRRWWQWERGPENNNGELASLDELVGGPDHRREIMGRTGGTNMHADRYISELETGFGGTIPGPVFQLVAIMSPKGSGRWKSSRGAVAAALKAAYHLGRKWAGLPGKLTGVPDPDPESVRVVCKRAMVGAGGTGFGNGPATRPCPLCDGTGSASPNLTCPGCEGGGRVIAAEPAAG